MASSSSPSSSLALSFPSSSLSRNWEHDVFPSFHGPDVRKSFLSHVLKEFRSKGIHRFIDNEIKRGEFIGPELIRAIRGSKILIVLLSKNYASSSWCLDELVEIMKKELDQKVVTIFYEVDPTDVKKQTGNFGKAFKKTCKGKTKEKIETWRKALKDVSTIAGYHSSKWDDESAMIEKIASDISELLNHLTPSRDFDHLIGMEAHMERMKPLLRFDLDEVRMIGIWGPPGIGKTTIAKFLFNLVSNSFHNSAILVNIRGSYPRPCLDEDTTLLQLQSRMLSLLTNQKDIVIPHLGVAQQRLRENKVLLVLDDVDRSAQLDALAKDVEWFGPGSRIIITTENLKILMAHRVNHIYKVDFPSDDEALQMFCMYAFDQKTPKDGFAKLAREVTYLVGQLPLGLKVMGSHFRVFPKEEWSLEVEKLRASLDGDIESILKFSYDALCDEDKDLFLHIACFFNYRPMKRVEEYLAESFKNITRRVIGIEYDGNLNITEKAFERMSNLQFLRVGSYFGHQNTISSRGPLHIISPKLRLLHWSHAPVTSLHFTINLVELRMDDSKLEKLWDGVKLLQNLKWMDLGNSMNLKELPNLSKATSLEELYLNGCSSLVEIHSSIGNATNLKVLDLCGCTSIVKLPFSIGNLHKLEDLYLRGCSKLKSLPININLKSLNLLDLTDCWSLKRFPEISTNIKVLRLIGTSIKEVPLSIRSWSRLDDLSMPYIENLKEFPSIHNIITELHLTDTKIQELGLWVRGCSRLEILDIKRMQNLVSLPQLPDSLRVLDAENCVSLEKLDCSFCNPYIRLNFGNCFKLNEKARDLIIQTSTRDYVVLPSREVPDCFTYKAYGSSVTVMLSQKPLRTSTKFKGCMLLVNKGENEAHDQQEMIMFCKITSRQNALTACISDDYYIKPILTEHLYIFDIKAREVTSTELVFEFKDDLRDTSWEIKECGVLHLLEHHVDEDSESFSGGNEGIICERISSDLTSRSSTARLRNNRIVALFLFIVCIFLHIIFFD